MKIEIIKKDINFGGIVSGINITENLNNDIISSLDNKLNELCLLVFKKQKLNDDQQIKFSEYFGKIEGAGNNTTIRAMKERRLSDKFGDVSNLDVNNKPLKGEIVIIVGGYDFSTDLNIEKLKLIIENKLKKHTLRDAVKLITEETNLSKKIIYKEAIKIVNTI